MNEDFDYVVKEDKINHPSHYTVGEIEVIDYIKDKLSPDAFIGYCMGNVLKYVSRWEHKDGVQDLKKAAVYLKWATEVAEIRAAKSYDQALEAMKASCAKSIDDLVFREQKIE